MLGQLLFVRMELKLLAFTGNFKLGNFKLRIGWLKTAPRWH